MISVVGERGRGRGGTWVFGWWRVGDAERWGCGDNERWRLVLGLHRQCVAGPHGTYADVLHTSRARWDRFASWEVHCCFSGALSILTSGEWWWGVRDLGEEVV